jgi:hypothetical protein
MQPKENRTRLRVTHDVFSFVIDVVNGKVVNPALSVVTSFNAGDLLKGDEKWIAPADGNEVKQGDIWLHVTHRNGVPLITPGWTAYIHKGVPICINLEEEKIVPPPPPPPVVTPVFPDSFILTEPKSGAKAEYVFVRILP